MKLIIIKENNKATFNAAVFLILTGLVLFFRGYSLGNSATAFLGLSFSILSFTCLLFVVNEKVLFAKVVWGLFTPALVFISPVFFTVSNQDAVFSYGYYYIGGVLYMAYAFQNEGEKKYMWTSIALFFLGIVFYDKVMIYYNFPHSDIAVLFNANYVHFKSAQVIHFISLVYLITIVHKNKQNIERKLSDNIVRLQNFTSSIISTSKNKIIHAGDLIVSLEEIIRLSSSIMDVSRMSIWEVDEQLQKINLLVCYDVLKKEFYYSGSLDGKNYPNYMNSLLKEEIVAAYDVLNDPKTSEFSESYAIPLGIKSMMDSPFFIDGKFKGILCCEEQRDYKEWDEMDRLFSMSISKLISISYYCTVKKQQYVNLKKTTATLEIQNSVMENINKKMADVNGVLTNDLKLKEKGIQDFKEFIDEISHKNAHNVRGPLSRVLGLIQLYKLDKDINNRDKYVDYMDSATKELDVIIREVSVLLNQRNY